MPKYSLEYVILAFGGQVLLENDETVTHVITDRDNVKKEKTKEYVQPQWIYDSVNFNRLLNVKDYDVAKVTLFLFRHFHLIYLLSSTKTTRKDTFQNVRESSKV